MSSTEPRGEAAAAALYDDVLAPLSARLRVDGRSPFPLGPDPSAESYYVTRPQRTMRSADFEAPACRTPEDFARALAAHWTALGRDELAAAAGRFARELRRGLDQT